MFLSLQLYSVFAFVHEVPAFIGGHGDSVSGKGGFCF